MPSSAASTFSSTTPVSRAGATRRGRRARPTRREVIETNVLGLMRITRLCLPHLIDGGEATSSTSARSPASGRTERVVVRRVEVRGARLHARAPRRPPGQAGARHERRARAWSRPTSRRCGSTATRSGQGGVRRRRDGRPAAARRTSPTASCSRSRAARTSTSTRSSCMALAQTSGGNMLRGRARASRRSSVRTSRDEEHERGRDDDQDGGADEGCAGADRPRRSARRGKPEW